MYSAAVTTSSSNVSTETPSQVVSSFDHLVTQWMSLVTSSEGKVRNSSHDHVLGPSTSPSIVKSHSASGVRGVGPAERTGKPSTRYWPGGIWTSPSVRLRLPRKPREMNPPPTNVPPAVVLRRSQGQTCERRRQRIRRCCTRYLARQHFLRPERDDLGTGRRADHLT